jgi:hypothetical protein
MNVLVKNDLKGDECKVVLIDFEFVRQSYCNTALNHNTTTPRHPV